MQGSINCALAAAASTTTIFHPANVLFRCCMLKVDR